MVDWQEILTFLVLIVIGIAGVVIALQPTLVMIRSIGAGIAIVCFGMTVFAIYSRLK